MNRASGMAMCLIAIIAALIGLSSNTQAEGFYVIPAVKEKIVIKEIPVCNDATDVGANAFAIPHSASLKAGKVYSTTEGKLIQITGTTLESFYISYTAGEYFRVAPRTLPAPTEGVKGPFYYLHYGNIAFAKYL